MILPQVYSEGHFCGHSNYPEPSNLMSIVHNLSISEAMGQLVLDMGFGFFGGAAALVLDTFKLFDSQDTKYHKNKKYDN